MRLKSGLALRPIREAFYLNRFARLGEKQDFAGRLDRKSFLALRIGLGLFALVLRLLLRLRLEGFAGLAEAVERAVVDAL